MKITKRVLSIILAAAMVIGVCAVSAFALEDKNVSVQLTADSNTYAPGDTVTVKILISNDYKATCFRFPIAFSSDVFEIPTGGNIKLTAYNDCLTYKGSLTANIQDDGTFLPEAYASDSYGAILMQWIASVSTSKIGSFMSTTPVQCFSFQLKVKSNAGGKSGTVFIPAESDLFYDQQVVNDTDATTISRVNAQYTFTPLDITVEGSSDIGITTYPGSDVVIDYDNKIIKNWFSGMSRSTLNSNLQGINATLTYVVSPVEETGTWGTGATVKVVANSTIYDTYTIVLYGDLDGDGNISISDLTKAVGITSGEMDSDGEVFDLAIDLDGSGDIGIGDLTAMTNAVSGEFDIDQTAGVLIYE